MQQHKKNTKMSNYDCIIKRNIEKHNPNWSQFFDHPYRILITGGSGYGKTNTLLKNNKMVIIVLLIKFIYMLKIQIKKNINNILKT